MLLCLRSDIVIFGHVNRFCYLITSPSVPLLNTEQCQDAANRQTTPHPHPYITTSSTLTISDIQRGENETSIQYTGTTQRTMKQSP